MKRDIKKKKEVYQKPQIRSEMVELSLYGQYIFPWYVEECVSPVYTFGEEGCKPA